MDKQRARFMEGAAERGVDKPLADLLFGLMEKFSGYGFNKSHAAPYALIAYQTAWLKANAPVEFFAGSMSLDISNTDRLAVFYQDARRSSVTIRPPDVNRSGADFDVEDGAVLYAHRFGRSLPRPAASGRCVARAVRPRPFDFVERSIRGRSTSARWRPWRGWLRCHPPQPAQIPRPRSRHPELASDRVEESLFGDRAGALHARLSRPGRRSRSTGMAAVAYLSGTRWTTRSRPCVAAHGPAHRGDREGQGGGEAFAYPSCAPAGAGGPQRREVRLRLPMDPLASTRCYSRRNPCRCREPSSLAGRGEGRARPRTARWLATRRADREGQACGCTSLRSAEIRR